MDYTSCPHCKNTNLQKDGFRGNKRRLVCKDCNKGFSIEESKVNLKPVLNLKDSHSYKEDKNNAEINTVSDHQIKTLEELIKVCEIDTEVWEIERWLCNKWEVGARLKDVNNKDIMKVTPLFQVKVWLKKKVKEIELNEIKDAIIKEMKVFAPKYKKIVYNKIKEKFLFEPDIPDLHFGKLAWSEESGEDFDIKIAEELALDSIQSLINQSSVYSIDRILFPIGNDYFNVNSKLNMTIHNTPQQEDTRWQKTFVKGRLLAIKMIDMLSSIAPVDVLIVPGNHDEERTFYLGDALECWYHSSKDVNINNKAAKRKYYLYGKNLIGFTHGYYEKLDKLPLLMSLEMPEWWSISKFREWQTGDKHHKKEIKTSLKEDESQGVMVRILSSLTASDAWTFDKGFVGSRRGSEAFIRHFDKGLIAQFIASI